MTHLRTLGALCLAGLTAVLVVGVAHANIATTGGSRHHHHHHAWSTTRCHHHHHRCDHPTSTPTTPAPDPTTPDTTTPDPTTPDTTTPDTTTPDTTTPDTTSPSTTDPASSSGSCQDADAKYVWNDWQQGPLGDYYADADWWATSGYSFAQKTVVCSPGSWYVQATADNSSNDGAVKSYPNVHRDFHDWGTGKEPAISSFNTMTSHFAHTSPGVGIYDVAYDIWLNGVASSGSTEVMIWTDNHKQVPNGSKVGQVSLSGHTWDVWSSNANHYIAFVPAGGASVTSGTLDLLGFFKYLTSHGRLAATSTVGQVDYGVEIVSTDGKPARWDFTGFDVTTS